MLLRAAAIVVIAACGRWGFSDTNRNGLDSALAPPIDATPDAPPDAHQALISSIAAGGSTTCVQLTAGTIKCWGDNTYGQLGRGTIGGTSATPALVAGITTSVAVTVGFDHACALLASGAVECWGNNVTGQLGNNTMTSSGAPVPVSGITNAIAVSAGGQTQATCCLLAHTCAVLADHTVRCWGDNNWGEIGDGTMTNRLTPVPVPGVTNAIAIVSTGADSCVLHPSGAVTCWGTNNQQELAGSTGIAGASVLAGSPTGDSLLVIANNGSMQGWAHDLDGQLGDGTTGSDHSTPVNVVGIANAVAAAVEGWTSGTAAGHGCALLADGTIRCWADNNFGQLGNGTTTRSLAPVAVSGITTAKLLAVGNPGYSCAVLADDTVACWGDGTAGELGVAATSSTTPVVIQGLP